MNARSRRLEIGVNSELTGFRFQFKFSVKSRQRVIKNYFEYERVIRNYFAYVYSSNSINGAF